MTGLSPVERAVRALATPFSETPTTPTGPTRGDHVLGILRRLRTSDADAFAAVLAECGVTVWSDEPDSDDDGYGTYPVSEGSAVIEGRVVELEASGLEQCLAHGDALEKGRAWGVCTAGPHADLYRVKPERSERHTEDAS